MRRGEVWWANLGAERLREAPGSNVAAARREATGPVGRRPVLLLSRNEAYLVRNLVTVAPISTRVRNIPVEVELDTEDGLPKRCAANLDSLVTIPKVRLERRIASLSAEKLGAVVAAIRFALDLGPESG